MKMVFGKLKIVKENSVRYFSPLRVIILCGIVFLSVFFVASYYLKTSENKIALYGFPKDAEVFYKILAENGDILKKVKQKTDENGDLQLLIPDQLEKNDQEITYSVNILNPEEENGKAVDALNLLINLNPEKNSVSIAGSGVSEYSDLIMKRGDISSTSKADWSGNFLADFSVFDGVEKVNKREPIELAFQGFNYADDASLGQNHKVEVYYDNITDVFSYMEPFGTSSGSSQGQRDQWARALNDMALEFSAVMVLQTEIIATFFDARMHMIVQRKQQELRARAHKDYHPSEQMCRFGTFMRSVARSERKSELTKSILNRVLLDEYLGTSESNTAEGSGIGIRARLARFRTIYCDPRDNDYKLDVMCPGDTSLTAAQRRQARARYNKDIDYVRTVDTKLTLDIDYMDVANLTEDEEDVISLAKNLYFDEVYTRPTQESLEKDPRAHFRSRSYAAKQSVAHNTFINIIGMKTAAEPGPAGTAPTSFQDLPTQFRAIGPFSYTPAGTPNLTSSGTFNSTLTAPANARPNPPYSRTYYNPPLTEDAGWAYMKTLLSEFGIDDTDGDGSTDDEIDQLLGERPSYYAQMEILTKKIYQHPNFYTNLLDKPANIQRIGTSMDAIALMNLRDRYESMLRREMIDAVLVEQGLQKHVDNVNAQISSGIKDPPPFADAP
tara:strand:- start:3857 stop:5863 length:2007 start_codon:yes stop_codon:yes gene_type:complete